jgi:hypothetical protein
LEDRVSGFAGLQSATLALRDVLRAAITDSPDVALNGVAIDLRSPQEMKTANDVQGVSLWLYRLTRFADLVNVPPVSNDPALMARPSLPVELSYLITPVISDPERRQVLAGRVLQALNDSATFVIDSSPPGSPVPNPTELRVRLDTIPLQEHSLIWQSLAMPPVLSLPYAVQVVSIDSALPATKVLRVLQSDARYAQIVAGAGSLP